MVSSRSLKCLAIFVTLTVVSLVSQNVEKPVKAQYLDQKRMQIYNELNRLEANVSKIAAEIIEINSKIYKVNSELAEVAAKIQTNQAMLKATQAKLQELSRRTTQQGNLAAAWLNFMYKYGYASFLNVALQASDFNDFLFRMLVIRETSARNLKVLKDLAKLLAEKRQEEQKLRTVEQDLISQQTRLGALQQRLASLKAEKETVLAQILIQASENRKLLADLDKSWSEALPELEKLLKSFASIPWTSIPPDSVSISYVPLSVAAEFKQETVSKALKQIAPDVNNLTVQFDERNAIVKGGKATPFSMWVSITVTEGSKLQFVPSRLEFGGLAISADLISELTKPYNLAFEVPEPVPGLRLTRAEPKPGSLYLYFSRS